MCWLSRDLLFKRTPALCYAVERPRTRRRHRFTRLCMYLILGRAYISLTSLLVVEEVSLQSSLVSAFLLLTWISGFSVAYTAFKRQHWLVQASMVAALVTNLFQPLAGSILEVKQIAFNHRRHLPVSSNTMVSHTLYCSDNCHQHKDSGNSRRYR